MKVVETRRARRSGTTIRLIDNRQGDGSYDDADKWVVECETHGHLTSVSQRMPAESLMAKSDEWCPVCSGSVPEEKAPAVVAKIEKKQQEIEEGRHDAYERINPKKLSKSFAKLAGARYEEDVLSCVQKLKEKYPSASSITPYLSEVTGELKFEVWAFGVGGFKSTVKEVEAL